MVLPRGRLLALIAGMTLVFLAVTVTLSRLMPEPHRPIDYMVIGTLGTFAALGVLFVAVLAEALRKPKS